MNSPELYLAALFNPCCPTNKDVFPFVSFPKIWNFGQTSAKTVTVRRNEHVNNGGGGVTTFPIT